MNREHTTFKTRMHIEYFLLCSVSSSGSNPRAHLERAPTPGRSSYPAEEYELSPSLEEWSKSAHRHRLRPHYRDGDTIDWWHEDASERERWKGMISQRGLRGLVSPLIDVTQLWFVMIFTGICVGFAGGWLDILVMWCALFCSPFTNQCSSVLFLKAVGSPRGSVYARFLVESGRMLCRGGG